MKRVFRGVIAFAVGLLLAALLIYLSPPLLNARQSILKFFQTVMDGK
ncbi:MAG TPA: hypothetical protein VFG14_20885 [Chthoniobacteraceae bacterium]|nr:hypothetical protein [Chthoniobacteraceae bacterium]